MTEELKFTVEQRIAFLERDLEETNETLAMLLSFITARHSWIMEDFSDWRRKCERIMYSTRSASLAHTSLHICEDAENVLGHLAPELPLER